MLIFNEPVKDIFVPKKPKVPKAATPEGDQEAELKAAEEAQRRARAALASGGQNRAVLTGGAPTGQRRSLLGSS